MSRGEFEKRIDQISEWLKVDANIHPLSPIREALLFKESAYRDMLDEARKEFPMVTHITYGIDHPIPREASETKTDTFINAEDAERWFLKWFGSIIGGDTK